MAFDPNAFSSGQAQPEPERRRKNGQFNPTDFIGDLSSGPQMPPYEPTAEGLAETGGKAAAGAALTAYGLSNDVITPRMAYDAVGRPMIEGAGEKFRQYVSNPLRGARDVAASAVSPTFMAGQVAREAVPEIAKQIGGIATSAPLVENPKTGTKYPGNLPAYRDVQKLGGKEIAAQMTEAYWNQDPERLRKSAAVAQMLESDPNIQAKVANDPRFAQAVENYKGQLNTSGMSKLGRLGGLAARTAARFAGPVGLGMAAYDIYELGKWGYEQIKQREAAATQAQVNEAYVSVKKNMRDDEIREEAWKRAMGGPR